MHMCVLSLDERSDKVFSASHGCYGYFCFQWEMKMSWHGNTFSITGPFIFIYVSLYISIYIYLWKHWFPDPVIFPWSNAFVNHWLTLCWLILYLQLLKLKYSWQTRSTPPLLMQWLLASPGHQQPWYWWYMINGSLFFTRMIFNCLCHSVLRNARNL